MNRVYLRKVRLNQGGYDDIGRYWGVYQTLWHFYFDDGEDINRGHLRAPTRERAKEILNLEFRKQLRFFR